MMIEIQHVKMRVQVGLLSVIYFDRYGDPSNLIDWQLYQQQKLRPLRGFVTKTRPPSWGENGDKNETLQTNFGVTCTLQLPSSN